MPFGFESARVVEVAERVVEERVDEDEDEDARVLCELAEEVEVMRIGP